MENDNLLVYEDISYDEIKTLNEEYVNLELTKTEFLKIISHGVGTPLNGLIGSLQLLKKCNLSDSAKTLINIMDKSVSRFDIFLKRILLVTELRLNKYTIKRTKVNLFNEINECVCRLKSDISKKGLYINFTISNQLIVLGDKSLLNMCIDNILANSIAFSKRNGIVEISAKIEDTKAVIKFIDHGKGFSDFILKNKFKPFIDDNCHSDLGLGLGLCLVYQIIRAHRGTINLFNNKYGGATVEFKLPYCEG